MTTKLIMLVLLAITLSILPTKVSAQVSDSVLTLAWSGDGARIISGYTLGSIRIWDAATQQLLDEFQAHPDAVTSVAWNFDATLAASGSANGEVKIWNTNTWEVVSTVNSSPAYAITSLAWSSIDNLLATGNFGGILQIRDVDSEQVIYSNRYASYITSIAWSHTDQQLAIGTIEGVRVVNATDYSTEVTFSDLPTLSLSWSNDDASLAIGNLALGLNPIVILDGETGDVTANFGGQTDDIIAIDWNFNGDKIAAISRNTGIFIFDSSIGSVIETISLSNVNAIAWSPLQDTLAYESGGNLILVDVSTPIPTPTLMEKRLKVVIIKRECRTHSLVRKMTSLNRISITLTATPIPTLTPAPLQRLRLTSMCSADPTVTRRWRVRNSNPYEVTFTWDVYNTTQTGTLTIPAASGGTPAEVFFETQTVANTANTVRIFVDGARQDVKASSGAVCSP